MWFQSTGCITVSSSCAWTRGSYMAYRELHNWLWASIPGSRGISTTFHGGKWTNISTYSDLPNIRKTCISTQTGRCFCKWNKICNLHCLESKSPHLVASLFPGVSETTRSQWNLSSSCNENRLCKYENSATSWGAAIFKSESKIPWAYTHRVFIEKGGPCDSLLSFEQHSPQLWHM